MNIRPLIRLVCQRFLGDFNCFVDMVAEHIPSPLANAKNKVLFCCQCLKMFQYDNFTNNQVEHIYSGSLDSERGDDMIECDQVNNFHKHEEIWFFNYFSE